MKTLIQQVMVGSGSMDRKAIDDSAFLSNITIPTVKAYADKYGYDYKLIDTLDPALDALPECIHLKGMKYCYEMFRHIGDISYDRIVCMDADLYIVPNAPPLPTVKAVGGAGLTVSPSLPWKEGRRLKITGGFYIFMQPDATTICNYFKQRINNWQSDPVFINGEYHNEIMLAECLKDIPDIEYESVGYEWNWYHSEMVPGKHIYHITGEDKQKRYQDFLKM